MTNKKELYRVKFFHEEFPDYLFYIYCYIVGKSKTLDLYCLDDLLTDETNKPFIEMNNSDTETSVVPQWVINYVYKDFKNVTCTYLSGDNVVRIDRMNSIINIRSKEDNVVHLKPITPSRKKKE